MRKTALHTKVFSLGYWYSSRSLGLFLHPYVTMQTIVREQFLRPLVLLPLIIWLSSWVLGFLIFHVARVLPESLVDFFAFLKTLLAFLWWWTTLFLIWWQIVLAYLYARFRFAFR